MRQVVEERQRQLETGDTVPQFLVLMNEHTRLNSLSDRNIGPQDWTLVLQSDSLDNRVAALEGTVTDLRGTVTDLQGAVTDLHTDAVMFGEPFIKNVATQALLSAANQQPQYPRPTQYFTDMRAAHDNRLTSFVRVLDQPGITVAVFATMADDIICSCNSTVHSASVQELDVEVSKCIKMFARHKELERSCRQEYVILNNYNLLQREFGLVSLLPIVV